MLAASSRFAQVTIISLSGEKIPVTFTPGDRLFDIVEGTSAADLQGPCGGNVACGQCHCILPQNVYTPPGDDEKDILDGNAHLQPTSRLACCVTLTEDFDGLEIKCGQKE